MSTAQDRYRRFRDYSQASRFPALLNLACANVPPETGERILAIRTEIESGAFLPTGTVPDGWKEWHRGIAGKPADALSFLDLEYWFYLRILDVAGFFQGKIDPFRSTRWAGLAQQLSHAEASWQAGIALPEALLGSLLGNAHDLSQLVARSGEHIIGVGQLDRIAPGTSLHIICDNFGGEFVADVLLCLAYTKNTGRPATLHVKQLPLFVSDTTLEDAELFFAQMGTSPLGQAIRDARDRGDLCLSAHPVWSQPVLLDAVPDEAGLQHSALIVLKGDLNYRRAIGDVACAIDTAFSALTHLPKYPMLSLRSVKSHCLAGVDVSAWPADTSAVSFPTDGSIFLAQNIPAAV